MCIQCGDISAIHFNTGSFSQQDGEWIFKAQTKLAPKYRDLPKYDFINTYEARAKQNFNQFLKLTLTELTSELVNS